MMVVKPSKPQYDILTSRQSVNLFLGGQGSGKSHCAGLVSATFISNFPTVRGIICANTYSQLNKSTLFRVREVWKDSFGMNEYNPKSGIGCYVISRRPPTHFDTSTHNFDSYDNIISFDNGMVIFIGSLDNYKAIDGMEVGWGILDETKDTKESAVKEVIVGRLRQMGMYVDGLGRLTSDGIGATSFNPLYIFTSPAKIPWLNEWFSLDDYESEINQQIFSETTYFKKSIGNKFVTISSTYLNRENLPNNYIENQKANMHGSLQDMLIYGSPFSKSGGEFYKCFDKAKHVGYADYNQNLPLHISWDDNVNPYLPCGIFQMEGKKVYMIDEIAGVTPNNTVKSVCSEIVRKYQNHVSGMFIYGDATANKSDTKLEKGHNFYTLIEDYLKQFRPVNRVLTSNPSVAMRGNWLNTVLENNIGGVSVVIGENCKKAIADLMSIKEASDGTKHKETEKDPTTGVVFQKWGHYSDLFDYLMCSAFNKEFTEYANGKKQPTANWSGAF